MKAQTQEQADVLFDQLMERPAHYMHMSEERQWEVDKDLGILDHEIPAEFFRPTYKGRWEAKFGKL